MKSVTLGKSIREIGMKAFGGCYELEEIRSLIDEPFTIEFVFPGIKENATLYVPIGTKSKYEVTEGWKEFKNIVEMDLSGIATVRTEQDDNGVIYNLSGQRLAAPHRGLNIIGDRKVVMK